MSCKSTGSEIAKNSFDGSIHDLNNHQNEEANEGSEYPNCRHQLSL